jgi:hypothetical protein
MTHARDRILTLLAAAAFLSACAPPVQLGNREMAAEASDDFLGALVARRAEYAWERLTPETREAIYDDDRDAFARDVKTADWSGLRWTMGPVTDYDIAWGVHVEVPADAVPDFLVDRRLVAPFGGEGIILLVQFTDDAPYFVAGQSLANDLR